MAVSDYVLLSVARLSLGLPTLGGAMRTFVTHGPFDKEVQHPNDWPAFGAIVDPMVLRAADVLLTGASKKDKTRDNALWQSLDFTALCAFFDLLVFEEQIPMVDYGATFSPDAGFTVSALYDIVNSLSESVQPGGEKPLVTVHVADKASEQARANALERLRHHGEVERR